ncbi:MAG TPA: hypothetical protein VJ917_06750 [Saprospiraceae bacterium]|nr:hypothetical protein [Saprospiraceae bacterium]
MSVRDYAKYVIYRVASKGLEVFLVRHDDEDWKLPLGKEELNTNELSQTSHIINLDDLTEEDQKHIRAKAIEADYHDIPSLRALIREDVIEMKEKVEEFIPDLEKGAFFAVKEALKKVMPNEYAYLKELKDIVVDRNQIMNL